MSMHYSRSIQALKHIQKHKNKKIKTFLKKVLDKKK